MKALKENLYEAPQSIEKIKTYVNFSFNTTFWNGRVRWVERYQLQATKLYGPFLWMEF